MIVLAANSWAIQPYQSRLDSRAPFGVPLPSPNVAPVISGAPATVSRVAGSSYAFAVFCSDANDDTLAYSLTAGGTNGFSIHATTGAITWGTVTQPLTVRVSDGLLYVEWTFTATVAGAMSWHPGHYIASGIAPTDSALTELINYANAAAHLRGVVVRLYWRDLETARNTYDFSRVINALGALAADKYLWLSFEATQFNTGNGTVYTNRVAPDYLLASEFDGGVYYDPKGGPPPTKGDLMIKLWNAAVVTRKSALVAGLQAALTAAGTTLAEKFEGIVVGETATGLANNESTSGYTETGFRDQLVILIPAARSAMPTKQILMQMNFLSPTNRTSDLQAIADQARTSKCCLGGPDSLINNPPKGRAVINGPPTGTVDMRGLIGIQVGDQFQGMTGADGNYDPATWMQACIDWGMNYGFWMYPPSTSQEFAPLMAYLAANPTRYVATYPSEF